MQLTSIQKKAAGTAYKGTYSDTMNIMSWIENQGYAINNMTASVDNQKSCTINLSYFKPVPEGSYPIYYTINISKGFVVSRPDGSGLDFYASQDALTKDYTIDPDSSTSASDQKSQ